jgi:hypothetical protein
VLLLCCLVCVASGDSCTVVCGWSEQKLVRIGTELCDDISWCCCYVVRCVRPVATVVLLCVVGVNRNW